MKMDKLTAKTKHIHKVSKKLANGKFAEYHYLYRGGPRFWSTSDKVPLNGPIYFQLYQEALQQIAPYRSKFREVMIAFLANPEFKKLKPRTQDDIKTSIYHKNGIDAKFGNAPINAFNDPRIRKQVYDWRDKLAETSERTADARISHLKGIVTWAVDRGWLIQHHLLRIKTLYNVDRSEIIWTNQEIEEFCFVAPQWLQNVLIIAVETGLRPADLHRLNRSHIKETPKGIFIRLKTSKNGINVSIPVSDKVQTILDAMPSDQFQVIVGKKGLPFTNSNILGQKIGLMKKQTSIRTDLHLYDARGTAASKLFAAGVNLRDLALFMGWTVQHAAKMVEVYCAMNPDEDQDVLVKLAEANR